MNLEETYAFFIPASACGCPKRWWLIVQSWSLIVQRRICFFVLREPCVVRVPLPVHTLNRAPALKRKKVFVEQCWKPLQLIANENAQTLWRY